MSISGTRIRFVDSVSSNVDYELVSGSLKFIQAVSSASSSVPILYLVDTPWCLRSFPKGPAGISWKIYTPKSFGGGVDYTLVCAFVNLAPLVITTTLFRTIGHFLTYNVKPNCVTDPHTSDQHSYSSTSLLQPSHLIATIKYTSTFFDSGWGSCLLLHDEIARIYGMSDLQLIGISLDMCKILVPIKPIQMLIAQLSHSTQSYLGGN